MITSDIFDIIEVESSHIPDRMDRRRILSITHNSKHASPTSLFVCKKGAYHDGHAFAPHAYEKGARVFIAEDKINIPDDAAILYVKDASLAICKLALAFFGDPASSMRMIGITGTKGKTTVAISVYSIACACGIKAGYIGTNGIRFNCEVLETANTTPDPVELQRYLRMMRDGGVTVVIVEVSSQALWQNRVYGIEFDTCVFTNLYEDHIGGVEHPDMEHYRASKKLLFSKHCARNVIVNKDSEAAPYMLDGISDKNVTTVSASGDSAATYYATESIKMKKGLRPGVSFKLFSAAEKQICGEDVFVPLPGLYSVENALLTFSVCRLLDIPSERIIELLSTTSVPGRFEVVEMKSLPKSLFIIDYAHNGASLTAVLKALRSYRPKRIICLFGSVGGRTFGRRRELALAAKKCADVVIITSDNPDIEDPMIVINDIYEAFEGSDKEVYRIPDRQEAIKKATELARPGDFVLLAGKGHETYQLIRGERVHFCEREILEHYDKLNMLSYK